MERELSNEQEKALLRKHLTGDCGPHTWPTIKSLIDRGYLADVDKRLIVTVKGKQYCDEYHMNMGQDPSIVPVAAQRNL